MVALTYVLLPITGIAAYMLGSTPRIRTHGLQAIALGLLWPAALFGASLISPRVTQAAFVAGALAWLALVVVAALGRDPRLPLVGSWLARAAEASPRARDHGDP